MYIVAVHDWQKDEAEVAKAIAETLNILVFEARQRIAAGGPVVLACFADSQQAEQVSARLSERGVPALVLDSQEVRSCNRSFAIRHFVLGEQALQVESSEGPLPDLDYAAVDLLLLASCSAGQIKTISSETKRKFSMGRTLLAGGIPMTKKVTREVVQTSDEREQILCLYARGQGVWIFDRAALNYSGLGDALQISRDLNFNYLIKELRRRAPRAGYDDRLLRRGDLVRLLGPLLSPETDLDLAFEILARSMRWSRT